MPSQKPAHCLLAGMMLFASNAHGACDEETANVETGSKTSEAASAESVAQDADAAADPIVCRRVEATGSRVRRGKVCHPKSVWDRHQKKADELVDAIERGNSTGVGGDGLSRPGT